MAARSETAIQERGGHPSAVESHRARRDIEPEILCEPDVHEVARLENRVLETCNAESILDLSFGALEWGVQGGGREREVHHSLDAGCLGGVHEGQLPTTIDEIDGIRPLVVREGTRRRDDHLDAVQTLGQRLRLLEVAFRFSDAGSPQPVTYRGRSPGTNEGPHRVSMPSKPAADSAPEKPRGTRHEHFERPACHGRAAEAP